MNEWKAAGGTWLQVIAETEQSHGLPPDLLARVAYQESHFIEAVIRGTEVSPAGALGMMQLMPEYFKSVQAPIPFDDDAVVSQITEAAQLLEGLYYKFKNWKLALAAYNAGPGNVEKYDGIPPFPETVKYVADISADVPSINA